MGAVLVGSAIGYTMTNAQFGMIWGCGQNPATATESLAQRKCRVAGTFSNYGASVTATAGTSRSCKFRKNTANGNGNINLGSTTAQVDYDNVNTDHVDTATPDVIDWGFTVTSTAPAIEWAKAVFTADSGHVGYHGGTAVIPASAANWLPFHSTNSVTTEATAQTIMRSSGSFGNMQVISEVATTGAATYVMRINGVSKTLTVTVATGTTGTTEDTAHTDAFVNGDLCCIQQSGGNSAGRHTCTFTASYNGSTNEVFGGQNSMSFNASTQFFSIVGGSYVTGLTTEATYKLQHGFACTSSNLRATISTSTTTGTLTIQLRKNGANANQFVQFTAAQTGRVEDTTHTDSIAATDDCCYGISGGTSGSYNIRHIDITEQVPTPQPPGQPMVWM